LDNSSACKVDADCKSGHCIDLVCCDTVCSGNCEACDVTGSVGACLAVTGAPHGSRAACTGGTGPCAATCDGTNHTACTFPGVTTACGKNSCTAAVATQASFCDGAGACSDHSKSCAPYKCDSSGAACATSCTTSADCASGFGCVSSACVPVSSKCSADLTSSIDTGGGSHPCSPYKCGSGGTCPTSCASSGDCQTGFNCDSSGHCIPGSGGAPTGQSGGCSFGGLSNPGGGAALLMVLGVLGLRRRSQR